VREFWHFNIGFDIISTTFIILSVTERHSTVIVSISASLTCCHTVLRLRAADWKLLRRLFGDGAQTSNYSFHVNDVRSAVLFYVGTRCTLNMSDFSWNRELLFDFLIYFWLSKVDIDILLRNIWILSAEFLNLTAESLILAAELTLKIQRNLLFLPAECQNAWLINFCIHSRYFAVLAC
jgi:hypothetical protein